MSRVLDVSELPINATDSRALIWWGNIGMMVIEGTVFALVIATFLYFRTANYDWPPATVPLPDLTWPTINLILLFGSGIPALMADRAGVREDAVRARLGMVLCVVAGIIFMAIRVRIMSHIGYKWSDHAFGSVAWTAEGMHSFHTIAASGETALIFIYSLVRPLTKKRFLDVRCGAVYWYFLIITWLPFYFLIYVQPWMRRKGM
jgi:heme/copper-type cytochrome/quinol oxidase subunit 3